MLLSCSVPAMKPGALQAANEAATKGFDDQTRRLKENMGTLETRADRTARAFKSMWDAVLDIGRPDTAQEMLIKAEAAFKKKQTTSGICARMIILLTMKRGRVTGMIVKRPVLRLKPPERRLNSRVNRTKCAAAERYRSVTAEIYRRGAEGLRTAADAAGEICRPSGRTE
ncbi:hypothetical protein [Escherichia coli]|uniref:hypothetical protein n=1 Tax=Escherichia coli TaxID=562 RepID=UPI00388EF834